MDYEVYFFLIGLICLILGVIETVHDVRMARRLWRVERQATRYLVPMPGLSDSGDDEQAYDAAKDAAYAGLLASLLAEVEEVRP